MRLLNYWERTLFLPMQKTLALITHFNPLAQVSWTTITISIILEATTVEVPLIIHGLSEAQVDTSVRFLRAKLLARS